jgi:hypothetical protein
MGTIATDHIRPVATVKLECVATVPDHSSVNLMTEAPHWGCSMLPAIVEHHGG